jgi:hypothetical protein
VREFPQIIPVLPPRATFFASYRIAHDFRREVESREAWKNHCQWYRQTAAAHQQELEKLRQDINVLGWFNRRKG